jgi:hypothetical protein
MCEYFSKVCREILIFIKIRVEEERIIYTKTIYIFLLYLAYFFLELEILETKRVEEIKRGHFYSILVNRAMYEIILGKILYSCLGHK